MIRFLAITLFLFCCIIEISFSQGNFREGYVISLERDTLFGSVDYRGKSAYRICVFKEKNSKNVISYKPDQIWGYGFNNDKYFESKKSMDRTGDVLFYEVIVKGLVSLFRWEDTFFIEKRDDDLYSLTNDKKEVFIDNKRVLINSNKYIGTLNLVLNDCEEVRESIQKANLRERSLAELVESYNKCKRSEFTVFKNQKPWLKIRGGLSWGMSFSQVNFSDTDFTNSFLEGDSKTSKIMFAGVSLNVSSPRISERFSFLSEVIYNKVNYYSFTLVERAYSANRDYVTIELSQLKVPIGFRYTFLQKKLSPYIDFGVSGTFHLSNSSRWIHETESGNSVNTTLMNNVVPVKAYQLGLWAGFGIVKPISKKFDGMVGFRYEATDGLTKRAMPQNHEPSSIITNYHFVLGIKLK